MSADIETRERLAKMETMLGVHGELLTKIDKKLDGFDERVRNVETKSAVFGTVAGGVVSLGMAYVTTKLKTFGA